MHKIFSKVLNKVHFVENINHTVEIRVNNQKIRIPIKSGIGFSNIYIKEDWMTYLIRMIPFSVDIFIDVGINIGQTHIKMKAFHPYLFKT